MAYRLGNRILKIDNKLFYSQGAAMPVNPVWDGLTAYYRMDETSGTNVADALNLSNGTTTNTWNASGKKNYCAFFTGGTLCTIPNTSSLTFSGSFTVSCWIYPTSDPPPAGAIFLHKGLALYNYRFVYNGGTYGTKYTIMFGGGINNGANEIVSTDTFTLNNWYNVVAVYNSSSGKKLYVNGISRANSSVTGTVTTNTGALYLGRYSNDAISYNFFGKFDEIGLWNRALSPAEVTTLYNNGNGLFY